MDKILLSFLLLFSSGLSRLDSCSLEKSPPLTEATSNTASIATQKVLTGAEQTENYLSLLQNKNIAMVVNQTSVIGTTHLVDSLHSLKINIKKIFAPEHGFRGTASNGEQVNNSIDPSTRIPILSLYGSNKKPSKESLQGIDMVVFDIQDVGARFYTYISTCIM